MNIRQIKEFFEDKEDTPYPLTKRLIKAGYQQTSGGYTSNGPFGPKDIFKPGN